MKLLLTIIAVALPVLGLLHNIYSHDKIKPEPMRIPLGSLACGILMGYFYSRIHFKSSARLVHWMLVLGVPILCLALCNTIVLLYDRVDGKSLLFGYPLMFGLIGCTLAILYFVHRLIDKQLERDLKQ